VAGRVRLAAEQSTTPSDMAHRLASEAEADLEGIWYYVATQSGSMEVADPLIDALTKRVFLAGQLPAVGTTPR
jgi:hypothetical protein